MLIQKDNNENNTKKVSMKYGYSHNISLNQGIPRTMKNVIMYNNIIKHGFRWIFIK